MTTRRTFIRSALGFLAAPAIVRVSSLMPVKALTESDAISMTALQSFDEMLRETFRRNQHLIVRNITQGNALLDRLRQRA